MKLTNQETAQVLAALRLWQDMHLDVSSEDIRGEWPDHFDNSDPMGLESIDALCEKINFGK